MKITDKRAKGFTLAEAMIATVVLAIVAAAVLVPFVTGASVRAEGYRRTLAAKLAMELIEQILREDFDNVVSNYNYTEPQGQVKDVTGVVYSDPAYSNYSRAVECVGLWLDEESGGDESMFIRATVRVYYNGAEIASVSRLIGR
ncbi:MAG: prepilin-type N-terminal cleavage/methylation domain-containing protein [Sedimentisphaerales bacterium]|nr:prepilin-type N-terminal cleavage/methylation domain-containing protein [Sedimentisphaerales bacterium]